MISTPEWKDEKGRVWAENFAVTDRAFSSLTQSLLERLADRPGSAILDIGCGAGELALALGRARPKAHVTGVDISPDLIATARNRGATRPNVTFELSDAAIWYPRGDAPDLLVSRHGVMFFEDPSSAFAHLRGIAAPGARLFFSCFRTPSENPWSKDVATLLELPPPPDPFAPGPFAFADEDRVRSILYRAGWKDIRFEAVDFPFILGLGEDAVDAALHFYTTIGGAAAQVFADMEPEARIKAEEKLRAWLASHCEDRILAFRAGAWFVEAGNPG